MRKQNARHLTYTITSLSLAALLAATTSGVEARPRFTSSPTTEWERPLRNTAERDQRAGYERVPMRPGELTAAPDYMPIGRAILAPTGFLEMCARSPSDCIHSGRYDAIEIRNEARKALVQKYDIAFGHAPRNDDVQTAAIADSDPRPAATDEAPQYIRWNGQNRPLVNPILITPAAAASPTPALIAAPAVRSYLPADTEWVTAMPADSQPGAIGGSDNRGPVRYLNWRNKAAVTDTTVPAAPEPVLDAVVVAQPVSVSLENAPYDRKIYHASLVTPSQPARQVQAAVADYDRIPVNDTVMRVIRVINNDVNRTIRSETDQSIYHKADYWAAPGLMRGARGDCEDFALEKRRQLIENGLPAGALSVAIVITRRGDEHAVLIVSTTDGDLVLDNLQYDVRVWRRADYTWVSRQAPGQTLGWVSLAPANTNVPDRQLRAMRVAYAQ